MNSGTVPQPAGKVALVTGGAVRVGRAIAEALAESGFRLAVHYNASFEPAHGFAEELEARGVSHVFLAEDLTVPGSASRLIEDSMRALGRIDLLVNNAAVFVDDEADTFALAKMKLLNVDAPGACLAAAAPYLGETQGSVVNIADIAGIVPFRRHKAYSRTQRALIWMTREKALELSEHHVRVNAVCPGTVLPPSDASEGSVRRLADEVPLGHIGRPEDVADAVLFLAKANYVTGQILCVDGGVLLRKEPPTKKQESFF